MCWHAPALMGQVVDHDQEPMVDQLQTLHSKGNMKLRWARSCLSVLSGVLAVFVSFGVQFSCWGSPGFVGCASRSPLLQTPTRWLSMQLMWIILNLLNFLRSLARKTEHAHTPFILFTTLLHHVSYISPLHHVLTSITASIV